MNIRTACFAALAFTVVGGAALFAGANANARDTSQPAGHKTPCFHDRIRLCPQSAPDKAGNCLKQHMSQLTPACRAYEQRKK